MEAKDILKYWSPQVRGRENIIPSQWSLEEEIKLHFKLLKNPALCLYWLHSVYHPEHGHSILFTLLFAWGLPQQI